MYQQNAQLHPGGYYAPYAHHEAMPAPVASTSTAAPRIKSEFDAPSPSMSGSTGGGANAKGGASEFVKKLYRMLEDSVHSNIVAWGAKGDSFLVKDMNEFTKTVLPLHFKHSNFASFVRQLNKYDFHKVKASEGGEGIYGDHTWEFKHPNFRADHKKSLEFIKRKGPAPRKSGGAGASAAHSSNAAAAARRQDGESAAAAQGLAQLQQQLANLAQSQHNMGLHMTNMSRDMHNVYAELMKFQNTFVAQDQLIQNIIQYLVRKEAGGGPPHTPSPEAQQLLNSYAEISQTSAEQLAELTRRLNSTGNTSSPPNTATGPPLPTAPGLRPSSNSLSSPASSFDPESPHTGGPARLPHGVPGLTVGPGYNSLTGESSMQPSPLGASPGTRVDGGYYPATAGHDGVGQYYSSAEDPSAAPTPFAFPTAARPQSATTDGSGHHPAPHQPQGDPAAGGEARGGATTSSTWKQLPRVLVVEDDVVCRRLSSRFLEVFGCQIDTAVDGVEAVKKMNMQPYDLVFMDIAMPNLDGVSATSIIRQFNSSTPIISMTSNSEPDDILTYFSHGMTDVLPKPFTKDGLRSMLEKHLVHLTQIKQLVEVPRALGFPESQISDALASTLAPSYLQSEPMFGQEPLNPYAEMGISDEDFTSVLLSTLTPANGGPAPPPPSLAGGNGDGLGENGVPPQAASPTKRAAPAGRGDAKRARYDV